MAISHFHEHIMFGVEVIEGDCIFVPSQLSSALMGYCKKIIIRTLLFPKISDNIEWRSEGQEILWPAGFPGDPCFYKLFKRLKKFET